MLKGAIEKRREEILKSLGFHYDENASLWKLKVNSTLIISDKELKKCITKEGFERVILTLINEKTQVIKALIKKKRTLIKLLSTTVY